MAADILTVAETFPIEITVIESAGEIRLPYYVWIQKVLRSSIDNNLRVHCDMMFLKIDISPSASDKGGTKMFT